jgi:glycosyltransferase involved in cell wall biosynthesis
MARILILIGGHLCTAPRPQKEAAALAAAGHDVLVMGLWFDAVLADRDQQLCAAIQSSDNTPPWRFQPLLDFRGQNWRQQYQRSGMRIQAKLAQQLFQKAQILSPALLGYGAKAMLRFARDYHADLTIVHSEAGLWVGQQLQQQGYRVGVDFEDWFSQDLLPTAQAKRPIAWIKSLEASAIHHCHYCLTTSQAMATAMAAAYDAAEPTVIYNAFPPLDVCQHAQPYVDRKSQTVPSLHWFSQTIGPGRGLETLFAALPHVQSLVEVHLRGNCPNLYRDWLMSIIPAEWQDRIVLHETVPNQELPMRIAEHDIGLALEIPYCPNKQFTTSNKLFQYLQAGLAVIATDTAGQREVLQVCPQAGQLIASDDPKSLAAAINHWVQYPEQLAIAKQAAAQVSVALAWQTQADRLVERATAALSIPAQLPPATEVRANGYKSLQD